MLLIRTKSIAPFPWGKPRGSYWAAERKSELKVPLVLASGSLSAGFWRGSECIPAENQAAGVALSSLRPKGPSLSPLEAVREEFGLF